MHEICSSCREFFLKSGVVDFCNYFIQGYNSLSMGQYPQKDTFVPSLPTKGA